MEYYRLFSLAFGDKSNLLPLSVGQYDIWLEQQLYPNDISNHSQFVAAIHNELQIPLFQQAFKLLADRHEVLRTIYPIIHNLPVRKILPFVEASVKIEDCQNKNAEEIELNIRENFLEPFNLYTESAFRFVLYRLSSNNYFFQIVQHHIADSMDTYVKFPFEFAIIYTHLKNKTKLNLESSIFCYTDYVNNQNEYLNSKQFQTDEDYWLKYINNNLFESILPKSTHQNLLNDFVVSVKRFEIGENHVDLIRKIANSSDTSCFAFLTAIFLILLHSYTDLDKIVVGIPNDTRSSNFKNVLGYTANSLPLYYIFSENEEFKDFLYKIGKDIKKMSKHRHYPLGCLREKLNSINKKFNQLFKILIVSQRSHEHKELAEFGTAKENLQLKINDLIYESTSFSLMTTGRFDLSLAIVAVNTGYNIAFHYNANFYKEDFINNLGIKFLKIIDLIIGNQHIRINDIKNDCGRSCSSCRKKYFDYSAINLFEKQVCERPHAVAVVCGERSLTYAELNERANQIARCLVGELVGVAMGRSTDLVATLLAVMKAGKAYLPLDPEMPDERLAYMLRDSGAEVVITEVQYLDKFKGCKTIVLDDLDIEGEVLALETNLDSLAYVIYTSGSTGKPKGVEIGHRALMNLLLSVQESMNLKEGDRWLALTTISFDIAHLEILLPLCYGACVVVAKSNKDPLEVRQLITEHSITFAQATPATWQMLVESGWEGKPDLTILSGGEAIPQRLAEDLLHRSQTLWNMYGPTETTIWSSMKKIESAQEITIGKPIANTTFYILDSSLHLVPIGVPGELYIGGVGLARGYRNQPDLTEQRFITSPFPDSQSSRLYKTGDRASYLPNGEIHCLGRLDHQVKIQGYRIELGEIEETMQKCLGVKQAIVMVQEFSNLKRLVAFFTGDASIEEVKKYLAEHLPSYMIPSGYKKISHIPLTSNGKLDRSSLSSEKLFDVTDFSPPQNRYEKEIASLFESMLGIEKIGRGVNFFALGGNSLLAARMITQINATYGTALALKTLFEKPTIEQLAQEIISQTNQKCPVVIKKTRKSKSYPLSGGQLRFWLLEQQSPKTPLYCIPFLLEIDGPLEKEHLRAALEQVVERHEVLRITIKEHRGEPKQRVISDIENILVYRDWSHMPHGEKEGRSLLEQEICRPFDLTEGPLFRFLLIRWNAQRHDLFINLHHIVCDAFSINLLMQEMKVCYEAAITGSTLSLPKLPLQYFDYVQWEKKQTQESLWKDQLVWWGEKMRGVPHMLNLPTDAPRPKNQTFLGTVFEFPALDRLKTKKLKECAQGYGVTPFMVLFSLFHVLLYRYTGQSDMVIGMPVSGRVQQLDQAIGCFINTLPVRIGSNSQESFVHLLGRVKEEMIGALTHQDVPFEKILDTVKVHRSLSHTPLFQVMFNMIPEYETTQWGDVHIHIQSIDRKMAHFDLSMTIQEREKEFICSVEYNTDLFREETIKQMSRHFIHLIDSALDNPEQKMAQMALLGEEEYAVQKIEWNRFATRYSSDFSLIACFEQWVERTPNATAIICGTENLTYAELNREANKIAHTLLSLGLKTEDKVVLALEREAFFMAAVLGVLKAGGTYIPIDLTQPVERVSKILDDVHPFSIVTHRHLKHCFKNHSLLFLEELSEAECSNPKQIISQEQLAYIIFTSGSTGKPKGVEIEHRSLYDRLFWKKETYPLSPSDVVLHTYSFIFDGAIVNYFWPLMTGSTLLIATMGEVLDFRALVQLIQNYHVTTMDLLPSLLQGILEEKEVSGCRSLKYVFSGGEALSKNIVKLFYDKCTDAQLHNTYGPTEATVEASVWPCSAEIETPIAPIGKPIAGATLYILDRDRNMVPIGVRGELYIGGKGLARGYFNDPDLTAEKFITHFWSADESERLYRTGDCAKYLPDGTIEFLGREDDQVKVRGYRIDLQEIESTLLQMDLVEKAVVKAWGSEVHKYLVAYVVLQPPITQEAFIQLMHNFLKARLPDYMIPKQVVILDEFALLPNGKINYKSLQEPHLFSTSLSTSIKMNSLELQLHKIWSEILETTDLVITDNFFDRGGNSLLAMRVVAKVRGELKLEISLTSIFQYPTIRELAEVLSKKEKSVWSPLVPLQSKGWKRPFFCVHPVGGHVLCYRELIKHWSLERPFYALQAKGFEGKQHPFRSIKMMARAYIKAMQTVQPSGPYLIGGWSFGGLVAAEIARQLREQNEQVEALVLLDTTAKIESFKNLDPIDDAHLLAELSAHFTNKIKKSSLSLHEQLARFIENGGQKPLTKEQKTVAKKLIDLAKAHYRALKHFSLRKIDVDTILIRSEANPDTALDLGWGNFVKKCQVLELPGDHWSLTLEKGASHYARSIEQLLSRS